MSPTLLEGVAVLVVIAVAWQIGVRLAPDIMTETLPDHHRLRSRPIGS